MPFKFQADDKRAGSSLFLEVESARIPVTIRPSHRAKRYVICVRRDGAVTVSVPRGGTLQGARRFLESRHAWIKRAWQRLQKSAPAMPRVWNLGTEILFRGRLAQIRAEAWEDQMAIYLDTELCGALKDTDDLRPAIERWMQGRAATELPERVLEFARLHQLTVRRITIRNQRSRWGSCSKRGTISLNWRLIQVPESVRDYIILHELMHLREMNHSPRFWAQVQRVCPDFTESERWLKRHGAMLGF